MKPRNKKKEIPYRIHRFIVLLIRCGKHKVLPFYLVLLSLPAAAAAAAAKELYALYSSPNYLGNQVKKKEIGRAAASTGDRRSVYSILVGRSHGK